ncbi:MAG: DUF983 domain-containing protein [Pseudomonadota bacterium]
MRDTIDVIDDRSLLPALLRGWKRKCPNCGGGPLLKGYLTVRNTCPSCGEHLHHHRADDMPAWATIMIVGHVIGPMLLFIEIEYSPPLWVHWAVWPALSVGMVAWLLPRIKGMVVAMQWTWRMHGFSQDN